MDGGGIRGFSQLFILEEIANRIMHDLGLSESPPLCDYFDIIAGVGTGGYLAILAGRLGLTVPQLKEEFKQLITRILGDPISSDELDNFLKTVVKRYTGDSETLMLDPNSPTSHCKTFVGAITIGNASYLTNFRSYDNQDLPLDIPIWQAARATLAHPGLFPPATVVSNSLEQVYVSGEIGWKNPSNEVIREFEVQWPSQSIACLASIGSGHEGVIQIDGSSVSESVADAMEQMAANCERTAHEVAYQFQGQKNYFRLSVEQGLQQDITRQPLTLLDIQSLTRSYLRSPDTSITLDRLVESLLHTIEVSPWTTTKEQFETSVDEYITKYSEFVEGISVASVKLAVQEGVLLLETIRDVKSSEDRWLVFAKMIDNHFNSMNHPIIMELREPLSSNPLWVSVENYFRELKVVRQNLRQLMRINPHRIWGPPTHDTFLAKATTNLKECFKRIPTAVLNEIHKHLVSAKRDARFDELISWISPLDMDKRHQDIQTRHSEGTGGWLIEAPEFKNWLANQGKDGCRALLGFGDPGAGKTFICYFAIEYLRSFLIRRRAALGHIYFNFEDKNNQNACAVIGELAKQLLLQVPSVPDEVWVSFDKHSNPSVSKVQWIFTLLTHCFDSTYICIDALDECEPRSRRDILSFLSASSKSSLHVFCTGRFSVKGEAMELLQSFTPETMEIFAHEQDIRQYLVAQIAQDRYKEGMDEQLQSVITFRLASPFQKLFILPAFQIQYILEHVTKRSRRDALMTIPNELFKMYDVTFERIQQQPVARVEMAMTILSWIYLTRHSLGIVELQHALAVQPGDTVFHADGIPSEKAMLDCCLGLVVIWGKDRAGLTHFTLREYLDKNWRRFFPSAHSAIASTCLTYLNLPHPDRSDRKYRRDHPLLFHAKHHLRKETNPELDNQMLEMITNEENGQWMRPAGLESWDHPLHRAAYFGIISVFKLVMAQTDHDLINIRTKSEQTPLTIAAKGGHEPLVRLLLGIEDVEADPRDNSGRTPLSYAAGKHEEAIVQLLLDTEDVDVDSKDSSGRTPLSYAAEQGNEATVRLLLDTEDVDVDSKDSSGRTPLSYAADRGKEAIVRLLLDTEDVYVDSKDSSGRTPFSYAAVQLDDDTNVIELLLSEEGVEPDSRDNEGRTPLSYAAQYHQYLSVWLLLRTEGVEADSRDDSGRTPLSYATCTGGEEVVSLLLDTGGVEADSRDNWGRTPLSYAASTGFALMGFDSDAVVRLLLGTEGVEADSRDNSGRTPLSHAAGSGGGEAAVRLLLGIEGVEAGSRDDLGRTPLTYAAQSNNEAVVRLLLDREDVDVNSVDRYGWIPLAYAGRRGYEPVIKLLFDAMMAKLEPNNQPEQIR